ncbi:AraC family transcriptional regulator [Hymenobacter sp. YC55]|uniref:helix-turn-helix domain-containing protein n=1 Tax=Hymenobacter sp. YC55 TaxID=3034019 RepID=UPI0023F92137|nr:AraC family transcriptional regulator [Hymenobacter sp. YC55]MDF7815923.1 AraC family transcriptional regulator [Hymenobacter sp. YC55]
MKKSTTLPPRFSSLAAAHQALGLPQPQHPLISLVDATVHPVKQAADGPHVLSFYKIALKTGRAGQLAYGQGHYDFTEGSLLLAAPNQLIGSVPGEESGCQRGTVLLVHPDFLLGYPLAKTIKQHGFFTYATNEALHLSDKEKATIETLFGTMAEELSNPLDALSQEVLLAQLDLLLTYAQRFYQRQFLTRRPANRVLLQQVDELLDAYFEAQKPLVQGLPTVHYLAEHVNLTPSYLSDMLRSLTGQNAQQHIHHRLIERAKERLAVSSLSVGEIAYELGFEHTQSFSQLFKAKTNTTPLSFRRSFTGRQ